MAIIYKFIDSSNIYILFYLLLVSGINYDVTDSNSLPHAQDCYFTHICETLPVIDPVFLEAATEASRWYVKGIQYGTYLLVFFFFLF